MPRRNLLAPCLFAPLSLALDPAVSETLVAIHMLLNLRLLLSLLLLRRYDYRTLQKLAVTLPNLMII